MPSTSIRRILIASGFTIATSFMTALSASATGSALSGSVTPSCQMVTGLTATDAYTPTAGSGNFSGGVTKLEKSDSASFNCNTDTVGVTAVVTTTTPTAPSNATALAGVHTVLLSNSNDNGTTTATATGNATATGTAWITNSNGDITVNLVSTWNPTSGEELLAGSYSADIVVSVTPN